MGNTDIKDLKTEVRNLTKCMQQQVANTKELIITHLAWHKGKDK